MYLVNTMCSTFSSPFMLQWAHLCLHLFETSPMSLSIMLDVYGMLLPCTASFVNVTMNIEFFLIKEVVSSNPGSLTVTLCQLSITNDLCKPFPSKALISQASLKWPIYRLPPFYISLIAAVACPSASNCSASPFQQDVINTVAKEDGNEVYQEPAFKLVVVPHAWPVGIEHVIKRIKCIFHIQPVLGKAVYFIFAVGKICHYRYGALLVLSFKECIKATPKPASER